MFEHAFHGSLHNFGQIRVAITIHGEPEICDRITWTRFGTEDFLGLQVSQGPERGSLSIRLKPMG